MPLQNRVDPLGGIHAVEARGLLTGNRGIIHDPATRTLLRRRWATQAWIICSCRYKDRPPRDVMGYRPNGKAGWTELFFLDEVTALAAGHRPCFTCRRERAKEYAGRFGDALGIAEPKVVEMDARLHRERMASGGQINRIERAELPKLPDGAVILDGKTCHAILRGKTLRWSFSGYGPARPLDEVDAQNIGVVTPATTLAVLRAGYRPAWHPSIVRD